MAPKPQRENGHAQGSGVDGDVPEKSRRVLLRLLQQMREGATTVIRIELGKGGVRDYREDRTFQVNDLPVEGDDELDRLLSKA